MSVDGVKTLETGKKALSDAFEINPSVTYFYTSDPCVEGKYRLLSRKNGHGWGKKYNSFYCSYFHALGQKFGTHLNKI